MIDVISSIFLLIGSVFIIIGTVGLVRMPDLYNRMHATTMSSTLGIVSVLIGATIHFSSVGEGTFLKLVLAIAFTYLSAPVGAFMLARASYVVGVPLTKETVKDQLKSDHGIVSETK